MHTAKIVVENVWKKFHVGERHDSLRDLLPALVRGIAGRRADSTGLDKDAFWALRGVSFEVGPGQALGVIGHNGAGKSTLLKLVTRILRPTIGRVAVSGRAGALIEIAAGFHPDLTGRENVFLQGAMMGMPTADIRMRFDAIVDFAGVSEFIDTPIKRYSTGMSARLGFAIAVHLDPDVLVIDEVLSVGDMAFQERAFGRMRDIVRSGIPVVVVSHQLERITELCTEAVLLRRGEVVRAGTPAECVRAYVEGEVPAAQARSEHRLGRMVIHSFKAEGDGRVVSGHRALVRLAGRVDEGEAPPRRFDLAFRVRRMESGQTVYSSHSKLAGVVLERPGPFSFSVDLQMNVPAGLYSVESWVCDADRDAVLGDGPATHLQVEEGAPFGYNVQLNALMGLS